MRKVLVLSSLVLLSLSLAACDSGSSTGSNGSGRIDPAIAGTWARAQAKSVFDTLILTDAKYQTPYGSGNGSAFDAKNGVAHCGPGLGLCGEYQLVAGGPVDTLYFQGLLGQTAPDASVPRNANTTYFRVP